MTAVKLGQNGKNYWFLHEVSDDCREIRAER